MNAPFICVILKNREVSGERLKLHLVPHNNTRCFETLVNFAIRYFILGLKANIVGAGRKRKGTELTSIHHSVKVLNYLKINR